MSQELTQIHKEKKNQKEKMGRRLLLDCGKKEEKTVSSWGILIVAHGEE